MIELHTFDDVETQAGALALAVGDALQGALERRPAAVRGTLAVSGGTSPRTFLHALSTRPLDWSRLDVTLIDDRWVADDDPDSNARLVRATLLQQHASAARFAPLADLSQDLAARVAALNRDASRALPDVAVLGMGDDGHTASLFADAPEWQEAITTDQHFVALHPGSAPHARISWSLHALKQVPQRFLLIAGAAKLAVLQRAAATPLDNGISKLANDPGVRLEVYWCA